MEFKEYKDNENSAKAVGRYRNRMEFKDERGESIELSVGVDIETEWNLKL